MRSILEEGQEEVPAYIWDGISSELDKIAARKKVILWWRRAAVAVSAAAVLAIGVFLSMDKVSSEDPLLPITEDNSLIAVVEDVEDICPEDIIIAKAEPEKTVFKKTYPAQTASDAIIVLTSEDTAPETAEESPSESQPHIFVQSQDNEDSAVLSKEPLLDLEEDWIEGIEIGEAGKKTRTDFSFSGIAGTNTSENSRTRLMKSPSIPSTNYERPAIIQTTDKTIYGIPVTIGAGIRIGLSQKWSLGTGISYSLLTSKFYGSYNDGATSISSDIRNSQHYIGIPINIYYDIVDINRINFYAYAGGTVEKCILNDYQVLMTSVAHQEKASGVQLSANLGFGMEFTLGKHLGLYIDPSLRYYFQNGQPSSIRTAQPLMLGFELGLRIHL
ncbi:MAG: PorT family protein [Bacteroidales bacterium]|nr:PorT family protein [Bacteroidales bacterium]